MDRVSERVFIKTMNGLVNDTFSGFFPALHPDRSLAAVSGRGEGGNPAVLQRMRCGVGDYTGAQDSSMWVGGSARRGNNPLHFTLQPLKGTSVLSFCTAKGSSSPMSVFDVICGTGSAPISSLAIGPGITRGAGPGL